jgi:tyrosyl-DNA phosphodiesterase 2
MQTSYKCPLCYKSCINMEYQFRNYDMAILTQPMPPEYHDARAVISCNDCSAKSQTLYHWLGLKCSVCNSYNTVQQQLLNMPERAASASALGASSTSIVSPVTASANASALTLADAEAAAREEFEERFNSEYPVPELRAVGSTAQMAEIARFGRDMRRRQTAHARALAEHNAAYAAYAALVSTSASASGSTTGSDGASREGVAGDGAVSVSAVSFNHVGGAVASATGNIPPRSHPAVANMEVDVFAETDESEEEEQDRLDFWGRDEAHGRNATSGTESADVDVEGFDEEEESEEEDDDDDADEDEEEEEEDEAEEWIVLFGHR